MCNRRRLVPSVRSRVAIVGDVCPTRIKKKEGEDLACGIKSVVLHGSNHHDETKDIATKHDKIVFYLVVAFFFFYYPSSCCWRTDWTIGSSAKFC